MIWTGIPKNRRVELLNLIETRPAGADLQSVTLFNSYIVFKVTDLPQRAK